MLRKLNKIRNLIVLTALMVFGVVGSAFAEETTGFDFSAALQPLQTQIISALSVAIGIGVAIFVVIFGVRKAVSLIRSLSGR